MTDEHPVGLLCCLAVVIPIAIGLFVIYGARLDRIRYMALGAAVQSEHGAVRVRPSRFVSYDISVVTTNRHDAPVALLLIARTAMSVGGVGANLTPEQARWLAYQLRAAAFDRDPTAAHVPNAHRLEG
jgi:hypothetical protein